MHRCQEVPLDGVQVDRRAQSIGKGCGDGLRVIPSGLGCQGRMPGVVSGLGDRRTTGEHDGGCTGAVVGDLPRLP